MKENNSKAAGKIFLVIAAAAAVLALIFSQYMGGQRKVIEKYYTSVSRNDFSDFGKCFRSGLDYSAETAALYDSYTTEAGHLKTESSNIVHVRVNFKKRIMNDISESDYYYTVSYYNDDSDSVTTPEMKFHLVREGISWKLDSVVPE